MSPVCIEDFSVAGLFPSLFVLHPFASAVGLIVLGALLLGLWLKLKRWWKLVPVVIVVALAGLTISEPITLSMKMSAVEDTLARGQWRENTPFKFEGRGEAISAYPIGHSSNCTTGFLVSIERSAHIDASLFARAYPASPADWRYDGLLGSIGSPYRSCAIRAEVVHGEDWRTTHPDACEAGPAMKFSDPQLARPRSFEMRWCRHLDTTTAYCEADSEAVFLASGGSF